MKLRNEFILHSVDNETVLVPTADAKFRGVVQGNKTVGAILNCLLTETSEQQILDSLKEKYDGDENEMREDIRDLIAKLREIGALDEK